MPFDPVEMQELIDSGRDAEIFERVSLSEIAETWCAYQATKDDRYWWAVELQWTDSFLSDRDRRERLIELIIDTAPDNDVLGVAAAGPLEDAIYDADECVEWLERAAGRSTRFREALRRVWIWSQVGPARFDRIEQIAGARLPRPSEGLRHVETSDIVEHLQNISGIEMPPWVVDRIADDLEASKRNIGDRDDEADG